MKKIICTIIFLTLISQITFGAGIWVERPYKESVRITDFEKTSTPSNGILYNGDQLRIDMGHNHYMKCTLSINKVIPNSHNFVSVILDNGTQIVRYSEFNKLQQSFYVWTDSNVRSDLHIRFFSYDKDTEKYYDDVFIKLSDVKIMPSALWEDRVN